MINLTLPPIKQLVCCSLLTQEMIDKMQTNSLDHNQTAQGTRLFCNFVQSITAEDNAGDFPRLWPQEFRVK